MDRSCHDRVQPRVESLRFLLPASCSSPLLPAPEQRVLRPIVKTVYAALLFLFARARNKPNKAARTQIATLDKQTTRATRSQYPFAFFLLKYCVVGGVSFFPFFFFVFFFSLPSFRNFRKGREISRGRVSLESEFKDF